MPLMKSLKKFLKGKSCGCSSSTRKHKRNVKRRYRGGYSYKKSKKSNKKGDVIFSSNSYSGSKHKKIYTH